MAFYIIHKEQAYIPDHWLTDDHMVCIEYNTAPKVTHKYLAFIQRPNGVRLNLSHSMNLRQAMEDADKKIAKRVEVLKGLLNDS